MFHEKPLCDICHQNVASVYISRIAFGKTTKQRLCEACARDSSENQDWFQDLGSQNGHSTASDSSENVESENLEFDDEMKGLFDHLEKTGGEINLDGMNLKNINLDELSIDNIEQVFASSLDLPAEELDEFLAEMESLLDEETGDNEKSPSGDSNESFPPEAPPSNGAQPQPSPPREVLSARCPKCGTTWDRLREDGRAGCARCYEAFEENLLDVMNRMQRDVHHVGKSPRAALKRRRRLEHLRAKRDHRLEMLQRRLQEAVAGENYEDAAALRDKIKMVSSTIVSDE